MTKTDEGSIGSIFDRLDALKERGSDISIGDIKNAFGQRSYGPILIVISLVGASPLGGIPTLPTLLAIIVVVIAVQIAWGAQGLWLPNLVLRRELSSERLGSVVRSMRPVGRFLDRWFRNRLAALTRGPFVRVAAAGCLVLAGLIPPLELVPFAGAAPFIAILFFGLALSVGDGILMLAAILVSVGVVALAFTTLAS